MIRHLLGIVGAIALLLLFTFLPFLPGRYDSLAVPLSSMAQVGALLGLVFVPCGLLWIVGDRSQRLAQRRIIFPALALAASSLVWAGVFLAALAQSGFALAFAVLIPWFVVFGRVLRWFRRRESTPQIRSALPFYLVIVPVVVVVLQFALLPRAVEFSRNRAIHNSAPLIAAIEQHRVKNGRYPTSLHSVAQDYHPGVMGVDKYRYEPHGEAYNLFFEQFSDKFGTQEFVVYNPLDEQVMTVHAADLLEMTPQQLALDRTRGYYAVNNASQPHWKSFWFD
jgi:hypothetical protein